MKFTADRRIGFIYIIFLLLKFIFLLSSYLVHGRGGRGQNIKIEFGSLGDMWHPR